MSARYRAKGTFEQRFWAHVDRRGADDCWEWQAARLPRGYGTTGSRDQKHMLAHRVSYELANGAIPEGMLVLHRCDNPPCVNPAHLTAGTQSDNMGDAVERRRIQHGVGHWNTKITEADVREIRRLYAEGGWTHATLAERFGIGPAQVGHILSRKSWRWVA